MESTRMHYCRAGRLRRPDILLAWVLLGTNALPSAVVAAECPADQRKENVRQAPTDQVWDGKKLQSNDKIIDMITATIDVDKPPVDIADRQFRLRKLTIFPCGIVPWS